MSNPFADIRTAVSAAILAAVPDLRWIAGYNGETTDLMRSRAADLGAGCYLRCNEAEALDGPPSADCAKLKLHLIICGVSVAGRATAAESAENLLWLAYQAVRQSRQSLSFLKRNWRIDRYAIEEQTANCAIVSIVFQNHVDFASYVATP